MVSTFEVTAAPAPLLVAPNHRRVVTGPSGLRVRFHAHGTAGEVVGLRRAGKPHQLLRQANARGRRDGVVRIRTTHLRPGRYDVVLCDSATGRTETKAPIWVYRPGSRPQVTTDRRTYRVGSPIRVSWTRAPGNNLDWVSFFRCHLRCDGPGGYLVYRYTDTAVVGSVTFGAGQLPEIWLRPVPGSRAVRRAAPHRRRLPRDRGVRALPYRPPLSPRTPTSPGRRSTC